MHKFPTTAGLAEIRRKLKLLDKANRSFYTLDQYAKSNPELPCVIWQVDPITDERVLPKTLPIPGIVGDRVFVRGCPGEI